MLIKRKYSSIFLPKLPNLMPDKFEVLIQGPVNSMSYCTDYTAVFEQQQYKEHNYQPKVDIRFEWIKIWRKLIWRQLNSVQCDMSYPVLFPISNCHFLAISAGDTALVVVNETLKWALVLWNRAAAQGRMISSLAPQAPCLIYNLGTRPLHRVWYRG